MAPVDRLPSEALAMCFTYLPFQDRILATLVSRAWRAAALAVPAVWSDIGISSRMKSPESTLALALSRTGRRRIDLCVYEHRPGDLDQALFTTALNPHMDHVSSIELRGEFWPFEYPAPALESFAQAASRECPLTENFLGGKLGKLRRLHLNPVSFPRRCPAVALVTELRIELPDMETHGLSGLFSLFPRLRSLALLDIATGHAHILRRLRPPSTLSKLHLQTVAVDADLLELCDRWSEHLTDVKLVHYRRPTTGFHLAPFLSDARDLVVDLCAGGTARIRVLDSRTRKRTLIHRSGRDGAIVKGLEEAEGCLTHLSSLTISATMLYKLCLRASFVLPALKTITLALDQDQERIIENNGPERVYYSWSWYELGRLASFVRSLEGLETLTLEMRCLSNSSPPTLDDGRKLGAYIPPLSDPSATPARRVRVRGLPRNVVDALSPELRALQVDCDVGVIPHSPFWI